MKNNFTQPFIKSSHVSVYILAEVDDNQFIQFIEEDELGAKYANALSTELDLKQDIALQLAKYLHENGLELTKFRELVRETSLDFSLLDETPGNKTDEICFHVHADHTDRPTSYENKQTVFVSLDEMLHNFQESVGYSSVIELGIAQLILERGATHYTSHTENSSQQS